jgi:TPR repeat protein
MRHAIFFFIVVFLGIITVDTTFFGQSRQKIALAEEGTTPALHVQQPNPYYPPDAEFIEITDPEGRVMTVWEHGAQIVLSEVKGSVIMLRGNDVTIRLIEEGRPVEARDRVELSYSVDGELIRVGTWRVSAVREDGTVDAELFDGRGEPSIGMDALVFVQKQQKDEQDKNQLQESIEEDSLDDPDSPQRAACLKGNAQACAELANRYFHGTGGAIDYSRAARYSTMACDGGSAPGCNLLGVIYATGKGVDVDKERALGLYRKACDGGYALGCRNLGFFYHNGISINQDFARAKELYRMACDGGDADGCTNLGLMYGTGLGGEVDLNKAVALYRRGCDEGGAMGCKNLGTMYEGGLGVDQDYQQAVLYYQKGCDDGEALGCANLGLMVYAGRGTATDQAKGRALFEQACSMGNSWSCDKLKELDNPK